ncbi:hypothetical protein EYF80_039538 [Liparis tanakae]|uniref:Uncharacterized protein n=1 Tax=Liparis tanakae TaxID=230148 RepID=A0A4Z2GBG9_9TELE|nr:hypothetical protein EYF80_039538 [Liparis tanakae]
MYNSSFDLNMALLCSECSSPAGLLGGELEEEQEELLLPTVSSDSASSSLSRCLIPNRHCIPVAHPPFLHPSSSLPPPSIWLLSTPPLSEAGGLSVDAHWSHTCHSRPPQVTQARSMKLDCGDGSVRVDPPASG